MKFNELMVLLVEPSIPQRKIIQGYLDNLGIRNISHCYSGYEALLDMQKFMPDLIISCLYLPDMSGTELIHKMRDNKALNDTAFLLASSETRFRYLDPIRQAGAIAILPKPFVEKDLKIALETTIDHLETTCLHFENYDMDMIEVLIVDDSHMARKHIKLVLSAMGLERFTFAKDGLEAVKLISDTFFDLIVTDYNMPRMDGKELIEYIRSSSSQASVPILMITSEENISRLAAVQKAGISAICNKPFEPKSLRMLIENILSRDA